MIDRDNWLWVASETQGLLLVARTAARSVLPFPARQVVFEPDGSFWTLAGFSPQNVLRSPELPLPPGAEPTVVRIKDGSGCSLAWGIAQPRP